MAVDTASIIIDIFYLLVDSSLSLRLTVGECISDSKTKVSIHSLLAATVYPNFASIHPPYHFLPFVYTFFLDGMHVHILDGSNSVTLTMTMTLHAATDTISLGTRSLSL